MNIEQTKILIEHVFEQRSQITKGCYKLCIVNGQLQCINAASCVTTDLVVAKMTELDIQKGFTTVQWDGMAIAVWAWSQKGKSCRKDLTH